MSQKKLGFVPLGSKRPRLEEPEFEPVLPENIIDDEANPEDDRGENPVEILEEWKDLSPISPMIRQLLTEFKNSQNHLIDGTIFGQFDQDGKFLGVVKCSGTCSARNTPFASLDKKSKNKLNLKKDSSK